VETITAQPTPYGSGPRVGQEIVNTFGWLLTRAPRLAKALQETPGASETMAEILAGFDLFHRKEGIRASDEPPGASSTMRPA
jgi:hypothetical protein